ncbi:hypothetical protein H105_01872 [Trichophyton soudanense CBS 452.61]|uniref:Uncharacterized protein n=1 Tax=Trichophyton soudanense CBS 452.61 TaxID=1215331 RepID=A0A022Y1K6_TRISD|nr:hypothetical protein H105_01872 [Trichophyton soudanense CBS 452.61]
MLMKTDEADGADDGGRSRSGAGSDVIIDLLLPSRRHAWQEYGCLRLLLLRWPMYMACCIVTPAADAMALCQVDALITVRWRSAGGKCRCLWRTLLPGASCYGPGLENDAA